ncbi:MAG: chorismate-binding protein [Flavobacteriales bacterium]|nr:chorismate-binding protein [Flavobacteriales bacterium]
MTVRIREALDRCIADGLTFAAFRLPGGPVQLWVQHDVVVEQVSPELLAKLKERFAIAPFRSDKGQVMALRPDLRITFGGDERDLTNLNRCVGSGSEVPLFDQPNMRSMAREQFDAAITEAKTRITDGSLEKVVLARTIEQRCATGLLPWLFADALEQRPMALVALVHTHITGTWLGASPERLLHADGDRVSADALAGTMPAANAPGRPEDWGEKEREEQAMVARSVLNTFIDAGLEQLNARGPEQLSAGPVVHLRSSINARLAGRSLAGLATALHPTPAVCGVPREAALEFITQHEPQDRQLYAGFWGPWQTAGRTDLFVNIRCLHAVGDRAIIHVGAGITAGSVAEKEWNETEHKARTWTQAIDVLGHGRVS